MTDEPKPPMREAFKVNHAFVMLNLERDRIEHERLVARRDDIRDKLRSGLTALNGGSLLALMAALNGDGSAAGWIGIDVHNAKWIAASFLFGLIAAGFAYRADERDNAYEVADSLNRVGNSERQSALYEGAVSDELYDIIGKEMAAYYELPAVGHRVHSKSITALALSQFFWLAGMVTPLIGAFWPS